MHQVNLSAVSTNWGHPLSCQSERVVFSAVNLYFLVGVRWFQPLVFGGTQPQLHAQVNTYVCTDFTIVEQSGESTLDRSHRPLHDSTARLVQRILQERGFAVKYD